MLKMAHSFSRVYYQQKATDEMKSYQTLEEEWVLEAVLTSSATFPTYFTLILHFFWKLLQYYSYFPSKCQFINSFRKSREINRSQQLP